MLHEDVTGRIIDSALTVHTAIGAGVLESTYDACLQHQFNVDGVHYQHQVRLPVMYQGMQRKVGLLINFNVPHLRQGIRRVVNGYQNEEQDSTSVSSVSSVVESLEEKKGPIEN